MASVGALDPPVRYRLHWSNIDGALRYSFVIGLLGRHYRPDLRVLEVGSGAGGITEFLQFPVWGLDPAFDRTSERATPYLIPVAGSATALPFEDESFDVVLSLEMMEHLSHDLRGAALGEMLRVLRKGGRLIVTFPAGATARRLDARLNEAFRARFAADHPWAVEHIREGVPEVEEIVSQIRELGGDAVEVAVHGHCWQYAWLAEQMLYSARRWGWAPRVLGLYTRPAVTAAFQLLRRMNFGRCYRAVVVVDR